MVEKLYALYRRTYRNCVFYMDENRQLELLNEIGVLRGIVYCIEEIDPNPCLRVDFNEFAEMIGVQNAMKGEVRK